MDRKGRNGRPAAKYIHIKCSGTILDLAAHIMNAARDKICPGGEITPVCAGMALYMLFSTIEDQHRNGGYEDVAKVISELKAVAAEAQAGQGVIFTETARPWDAGRCGNA